jgi:hypothetical protein
MATRNSRKKRSGGRLSVRRRKRVSDSVFGDLAVPSLHDVTLKMQRATDAAEEALLSFKPINYRRIHKIHKRWKNKKYRIVSGGTKEEEIFEREVARRQKDVEAAKAALEAAINQPPQDVDVDDDSCVKSQNNPEYTLNVTSDKTFTINRKGPNDFQALMLELANSGNNTDVVFEEEEDSIDAASHTPGSTTNPLSIPLKKSTASEIPVDVAAAVAGAAAGAAAAAALFTDDNTPAIKIHRSSGSLDWGTLKTRWIDVNRKCEALSGYIADLKKDAGSSSTPIDNIGVIRQIIFDWLQITKQAVTVFDTTSDDNKRNSKNQTLYEALNNWIAKWNEYSGKIRVIVSIKGGEVGTSGENPKIIEKAGFNTTKTTFKHGYNVPSADKKAYSLKEGQYGNFYAGFDAADSNATRYKKGNFKDLIETLLKGGNAAIFGYGYSGSGKTYTLTNYEASKPEKNGIAITLLQELLNMKQFTIELSIFELYYRDFTITTQHNVEITKPVVEKPYYINPAADKGKSPVIPNPLRIDSVDTFITAIEKVKNDRIKDKHIKYTLNNPESSRGHLFYKFTLFDNAEPTKKLGTLTIVDMGGRENPVELSESSHMVIDKIMDKGTTTTLANIGQIVERTEGTKAVFFTKDAKTGAYPSEPNKTINLTESELCKKIKHITGGFYTDRLKDRAVKCPSILAPSFGGLFYQYPELFHKDDDTVYDKLPLSDDARRLTRQTDEIKTELKTFLQACKEGVYINETIQHLVAYINFLSNISKIKDIPDNIAIKDASGKKGTLISLDSVKNKTEYIYHPERFIINPLKYIKHKYNDDLRAVIKDDSVVDKIKIDVNDTIGILKKLMEIKEPGELIPAIICFIACVRNDNTLPKNQEATKATLEFAMSVSASNAPPSDPKILSSPPAVHVLPSVKKSLPEKDMALIKKWENSLTLASEKIKNVVEPWVKTWLHGTKEDKKDKNKFINFLREKNSRDLIGKLPPNEKYILDELKSKIFIRYLRYIIDKEGKLGISSVFTTSISILDGYDPTNKKLVIDAKDLTQLKTGMRWISGGSGIGTRKRKSRREKKNRMTRRRNRI